MYFANERNPWVYYQDFEPTLDFCLWILQVDGLCVPPFDQHPDGNGSLRALGLTAPDWQAWFLRAIDPNQSKLDVKQLQQQALAAYLQAEQIPDVEQLAKRYRSEVLKISHDPPLPRLPPFRFYHASWQGSDAIRSKLIELQEQFQQVLTQHERVLGARIRANENAELRLKTRLYDELRHYQSRISSLTVHFVGYEYPLDYVMPPATLLVTVQDGQPDPEEYRERVLAAVAELAARSSKRQKPSSYTRIAGHFGPSHSIAYRRHARKAVLPPVPKTETPQISDPPRQAVLEELSNERFYGTVDLSSLHFLREKQRPGWKLYEVTFQETDGDQQRMIFILQKLDDGSWQCRGGGSSSDRQQDWVNMVAPVHDHPLLFLTLNWMDLDTQQFLMTAHGAVIDNGFHVERVRLVTSAGQVLEDTVEESYVFFACRLEEQVQLPMQAELYGQQGKLVWRQIVGDMSY